MQTDVRKLGATVTELILRARSEGAALAGKVLRSSRNFRIPTTPRRTTEFQAAYFRPAAYDLRSLLPIKPNPNRPRLIRDRLAGSGTLLPVFLISVLITLPGAPLVVIEKPK